MFGDTVPLTKIDMLSSSGGCDSFCQNAKRYEDQSLNQFEKDLKNFAEQFGITQSNVPQNIGAGSPVFGQDVNNIRPTIFNQISLNIFKTPKPGITAQTTSRRQLFTTQKPRVALPLISNRPSSTPSTTTQPKTTSIQTTSQPSTSTPKTSTDRSTTISVTKPTTEREENKNSKGVSIPAETTTKKNTKITFTFNGVSNHLEHLYPINAEAFD
jgi:hypothetical protein